MNDLIKALQIFLKYDNRFYPTGCEHDVLYVDINPQIVSEEDKQILGGLGFTYGNGEIEGVFYSYRFGSCF